MKHPIRSMTDQHHPIAPPPELVQQWLCLDDDLLGRLEKACITITANLLQDVATRAAQWGADQELEAVVQLLFSDTSTPLTLSEIRAARRPKPPSKVAQAEAMIERHNDDWMPSPSEWHVILEGLAEGRRALEALPE